MRKLLTALVLVGLTVATGAVCSVAKAADPAANSGRVFELRTYVTFPDKLDSLHTRFRDVTCRIFKKHGIEVVGFWTPAEGDEAKNTLTYLVVFPSKEAQKKAWEAFGNDPEWKKAFKDSHKNGVIVSKVISKNLTATDYSPLK